MAVSNKNEIDGPPAIGVDVTPNAPAGQLLSGTKWYQSEWTTDQALFISSGGRTSANFWTAGIFLTQVRKFTVTLPGPIWNMFKSGRHIYFRVGSGTTQNMGSWLWSAITDIVVNHMPVADAGSPQSVQLAVGGTVSADIILDASASTDPDAGSTLSYTWKLKSSPPTCYDQAFLSALRTRISGTSAQVTAFPTGTVIPLSAEGTYVFTVDAQDNDPPSFKKNTLGKDDAEVRVTVGSCVNEIRIDSPTSAGPARRTRPGAVDVEIAWRMDPALHQQLQSSYPGSRLKLSIVDPLAPVLTPPVHTEIQTPVPPNGMFIWSGVGSNSTPVAAGAYDVRVALLDSANAAVAISGFTTAAFEVGAIVIDAFAAQIDPKGTPSFSKLGLIVGIAYEVTAPEPPDDITIVIGGPGGTTRTTLTPLAGYHTLTPTAAGLYTCRIEVKRGAQVVVVSNVHELWILDDPLAPTVGGFPVGQASYDATTDPLAPAATRTLTLAADVPDGFPSAMMIGIHALVRYPAAIAGVGTPIHAARPTYPLVLIVHGNHGALPAATGSYTGFDYLAIHLAAQGFIAVSLEMEALQSLGSPSINHRARVINAHLERWIWKNGADPLFTGRVDLTRVGLIGHSRGGEAIVNAVALGTPAGVTVLAVASLAATDFIFKAPAGYAYLCLYGSVDGDVAVASGFRLYDRATRPKAQVFLYGGTHNDFCNHADWVTERQEGAPSRILPRIALQFAAKAFVAAFLQWNLYGREEMAWYFDSQNTPPSLRALVPTLMTVKSLELAFTLPIDRFTVPPITATDTTLVTRAVSSLVPFEERSLKFATSPVLICATPYVQQDTDGAYLGWTTPSAYVIELVDINVSAYRVVTFRVAQAISTATPPADPRNPAGFAKELRLMLVDTNGQSAVVRLADFQQAPPYPYVRNDEPVGSGFAQSYAELATKSAFTSARVPLWAFQNSAPKLDLAHIFQLRLLLDGTGLIVLDDIEFSA